MESEVASPPPPAGAGDFDDLGYFTADCGNPDIDLDQFRHCIDDYTHKADELERKIQEVVEYFSAKKNNNVKAGSAGKEKDKTVGHSHTSIGVHNNNGSHSFSKKMVDVPQKEVVCTKRMQDLMRQFGTIMKHVTAHEWAQPFMDPVDVKGLGLHDYHKIIKKPMDFSTIKKQMEANDGTGYKSVREIYADVRLIFTNAMKYNDDRSDVHVMAKTLLEKFEEKWLLLLPKVVEEEVRQKEEEERIAANMKIAQEASFAKLAKETNVELDELNSQLEELKDMVLQKCRKMSTEEKIKLGKSFSSLTHDDLNKALKILAESDPRFQTCQEVVEVDVNAQSESTLWKLKLFVKEALENQAKTSLSKADENSKRKKEICDALAKTAKKRINKKLSI